MTTPRHDPSTQPLRLQALGPPTEPLGQSVDALAWLAGLTGPQQQALRRAVRTFEALGPVFTAVARVRELGARAANVGTFAVFGAARATSRAWHRWRGQATLRAAAQRTAYDLGRHDPQVFASIHQSGITKGELARLLAGVTTAISTADPRESARHLSYVDALLQQVRNRPPGRPHPSPWWQRVKGDSRLRAAGAAMATVLPRLDPDIAERIHRAGISSQELARMLANATAARFAWRPDQARQHDAWFQQLAQTARSRIAGAGQATGRHRDVGKWTGGGTAGVTGAVPATRDAGQPAPGRRPGHQRADGGLRRA